MVIPTNSNINIKSTHQLKDLKGFEPKTEYGTKEVVTTNKNGETVKEYYNKYGIKIEPMKHRTTQTEMGKISNLITDMTLQGAPENELARAVKHSMVVIDAEKHKLDYKQSFIFVQIPSIPLLHKNS